MLHFSECQNPQGYDYLYLQWSKYSSKCFLIPENQLSNPCDLTTGVPVNPLQTAMLFEPIGNVINIAGKDKSTDAPSSAASINSGNLVLLFFREMILCIWNVKNTDSASWF